MLNELISATSPYTWWQKVLQYPIKKRSIAGLKLIAAVQKILKNVVHSVKTTKVYTPPAVSESSGTKYAKFDLVDLEEMHLLFQTTRSLLLKKEETLVQVRAPAKVFGDIHGQIADLVQFFRQFGAPSHRVGDINICNYVFNGDFVDRGAYSLEVLVTLCALKVRYHPHVTLIRGNHEAQRCNVMYGFVDELHSRLGKTEGAKLYSEFILPVFQCLPLAAVIEKKIFVAHGGPGWHVRTLEKIRKIRRPITFETFEYHRSDPCADQNVVTDLLWSDPIKEDGVDTTTRIVLNKERGAGSKFGGDLADEFCRRNGLDMIVRAHEVQAGGVSLGPSGRVLTVFSAPRYCGQTNAGAILEISRDLNVHFKAIASAKSRGQWANTEDLDVF
eukprot:g4188.t1